ncbi:MAG TPA: hypothetical protein VER55_15665 [Ardenticatenaceae bacterium]|nr:hypothetical protein [Ardenticatenaceae bacterium]
MSAYPLGFGVLIFLDLVNGLLPLATTWVTKVILDLLAMSLQGDARTVVASTLVVFPIILIILELTGRLIMPVSAYLNGELQRRLTHRAQDLVYQKINSFVGLAPFEDPNFHDTIQLASHGAQLAPSLSVGTFTAIIRNTVTITSFIAVLVALSPLLAGLAVVASRLQ